MKNLIYIASLIVCAMLLYDCVVSTAKDVQSQSSYDGLAYDIENGEVTILEIYSYTVPELVIPDYISGYPVVAIVDYAFYNVDTLVSVTLPKHLKYIGICAFAACDKLVLANFRSDAPTLAQDDVFYRTNERFCCYYPNTANGFSSPYWSSYLAKPYSIDVVVGDANCDGLINTGDAVTIMQYSIGEVVADAMRRVRADINNDGSVNTGDAVAMLRAYVGERD